MYNRTSVQNKIILEATPGNTTIADARNSAIMVILTLGSPIENNKKFMSMKPIHPNRKQREMNE